MDLVVVVEVAEVMVCVVVCLEVPEVIFPSIEVDAPSDEEVNTGVACYSVND